MLARAGKLAHHLCILTAVHPLPALDPLLERDEALAALGEALDETRLGRGRMLLVAGEAGVGKTSLIRAFCRGLDDGTRVLAGSCDALSTPRPLGPLNDIASAVGGSLADLVQLGAPPADVFAALRDELATTPTVVVLEDMHWADEATLDVLRLLARRVETLPTLVLATYRDDELDRGHPTRVLAGDFATVPGVGRLALDPLSTSAVAELASGYDVDLGELYARTGGNPFFVIEALEAGEVAVPVSVRDAVLARTARLGAGAASLVEVVAIAPPRVESWLLLAVADDAADRLDECVASGVLTASDEGVVFRHELARMAVEESLTPARRTALHRTILAALAAPPTGTPDLVRLAHHAVAAEDAQAVLAYAPKAAERAASVGAYREAAAHYACAIRFADGLSPGQRAELLERRSEACYLADDQLEAIALLQEAVEYYREEGATARQADALSRLTSYLLCRGLFADAEDATNEAMRLTHRDPLSPERARASAARSVLHLNGSDLAGAIDWARQAVEIAEFCGDEGTLSQALVTLGTAEVWRDPAGGTETLERALAVAQRVGRMDQVARVLNNLGAAGVHYRSYDLANTYLPAALDHCTAHNLDLWRINVLAVQARSALDQGRWTEAAATAAVLLEDPRESPWPQFEAFVVLALIRARRGDPEARAMLNRAGNVGASPEEFESVAALATAQAEIAWLESRTEDIDTATAAALDLAVQRRAPWVMGALADWRRKAGIDEAPPAGAAEPYAFQLAGAWEQAADAWSKLGCPYEAALARAEVGEEESLRHALEELQRLGALPASRLVARRLRALGARGLSRGPRDTTRQNPAGLTAREVEVLRLLTQGLRNAQIAGLLYLSSRTVDHHVSAILRKLGASTRGEATATAIRLGLVHDT